MTDTPVVKYPHLTLLDWPFTVVPRLMVSRVWAGRTELRQPGNSFQGDLHMGRSRNPNDISKMVPRTTHRPLRPTPGGC